MKSIPAILVAVVSGLIVLIGTIFPIPQILELRGIFLNLAIIVGGFALLIGVVNLVSVHWNKIFAEPHNAVYSAVLLAGFLCVLFTGLVFGPANRFFTNLSSTVIFTVESSLLAVLSFSLIVACFKLFQKRQGAMGIIFAVSTVVFLLTLGGMTAIGESTPLLNSLSALINDLPLAGARGILLGVSIGAIVTGLRVLAGIDRPYRG